MRVTSTKSSPKSHLLRPKRIGARVVPATLAADANSYSALRIGDWALVKSAKKRQKATSNVPGKWALESCEPAASGLARSGGLII